MSLRIVARVYGGNVELCRFFEEVRERFFPKSPVNIRAADLAAERMNAAFRPFVITETTKLTARKTAAPAQVPASRCAPDAKPERRRSSRGLSRKPRKRSKQ